MITVLVVDDERIIREGLIQLIRKKCPNYLVIGEAADGEAALQQTRLLHPDVAIVDIRMPVMGGIDYMRLAAQEAAPPSFIALTGYADFEYARQLMGLGCEGYLLKPLKHPELIELLERIAQKKQKIASAAPMPTAETADHEQEELLRSLSMGQCVAQEMLVQKGLSCLLGSYWHILVSVDGVAKLRSQLSGRGMDWHLASWYAIPQALRRMAFPERVRGVVLSLTDRTTALLLFDQSGAVLSRDQVAAAAQLVRSSAQQNETLSLTLGISGPHHGIESYQTAYEQSVSAVGYRFYDGCGRSFDYNPLRPLSARPDIASHEHRLLSALDLNDGEGSRRALDELFQKLCFDQVRKSAAVMVLSKLYIEIINVLEKQGYHELLHGLPNYESFETLLSGQDLFIQMRQQFDALITHICRIFDESANGSRAVRQAKQYVLNHMNQPVGAVDVAQALGMNPSYFSAIFKKETGENFTNYVNGVKMEQAKQLLRQPACKVYEVCRQVGFEDAKYFAKLFRRTTGMTPSEYREGKKKE